MNLIFDTKNQKNYIYHTTIYKNLGGHRSQYTAKLPPPGTQLPLDIP